MNCLSFKEIVDKNGLKDEATSNIKRKEFLDKLTIAVGIYMRDDKFTTTAGIVNLHPTKGTHWVMFSGKFYFDSFGCLQLVYLITIKKGIYSEYQIQKNDSYCAAYCLYVLYLRNTIGFKNAVLYLYYQNLYFLNEEN